MAAGVVIVPWYATGFRSEDLAEALAEIAPIAMRYGATHYAVYRSRDDLYKFQQIATFEDHDAWDRYWYGDEFSRWRAQNASRYQVPVLYYWADQVTAGTLSPQPVAE